MSSDEEKKEQFFEQDSEEEEEKEDVRDESEDDESGEEEESHDEEDDNDDDDDEKDEKGEDEHEESEDDDEGENDDEVHEEGEDEHEEQEEEEQEEQKDDSRFDNDRTVFVGHLWRGCTEGQLRSLFSGSGDVSRVRMPVHKDSGRSMGVAFVEFAAPEHASRALRLDGRACQGVEIKVKMASSHSAGTKASRNAPWRRKAGMRSVDDDCTVYVGGLSLATDEKTLIKEFGRFGRIKRVNIPLWHDSGRKRGFALIEFAACDAAHAASEKMAGHTIDGREIKTTMYHPVDPSVFKKNKNKGGPRNRKMMRKREKLEEDKNYAPQAKKPKK